MFVRHYKDSDTDRLAHIFRDAVRVRGPKEYDSRQTEAWSAAADDPTAFSQRLARGFTMVGEQDGQVVSFGQLFPSDVLELLYCDPAVSRKGMGGFLLTALENHARTQGQLVLDTKSSLVACPFFSNHGYREVEQEVVTRAGVAIPRVAMRKILLAPSPRRWVVIGNAGSGKTTFARKIAQVSGAAVLDLDTLAWREGTNSPVRKPVEEVRELLREFCTKNPAWVVEGCYEDLAAEVLPFHPCLVWIRTSVESCLSRCKTRHFEPHKFLDASEQKAALPALLEWVSAYPRREGPMSEAAHRALYESYDGEKYSACPDDGVGNFQKDPEGI